MLCDICGDKIPTGDKMELHGKTVCEDCFIIGVQPPKTCDVAAVDSAKLHRKLAGQTGTEGLTQLQKDIYDFVKSRTKVTREEITGHFKLPAHEMERQFTVLRHCELLKGTKEENIIYITTF